MPDPLVGQTIGDCRVEALLGAGSAARVYRAVQLSLDRPVALKVLATDRLPAVLVAERFRDVSAALARIEHPFVLPVYACGVHGGLHFLVLRLAQGPTLAGWLREPRPAREVLQVLSDVASALATVHARGEAHRALTPGNVFVEHGRGVLADPGLARLLDEAGSFRGSDAPTVAPEAARGDGVTPRGDVWSFGVLLHEVLAGRPPFAPGHGEAPLPIGRTDLPEEIEGISRHCLELDPAARFADGAELARAWESALTPRPARPPTPPRGEPPSRLLSARAPAGGSFGRYRILAELGKGAMGVVYRAYDPSLDRQVALKVIKSGGDAVPEVVQRFEREARAAAKLRHPAVIPVYDVGQHEGRTYFTMELVEGVRLDRWLKGEGRTGGAAPPLRTFVSAVEGIARALGAAHALGIVHRDVKPGNVFVDAKDQPHLGDFGLARQVDDTEGVSRLTRPGAVLGTPAYMSPEQANGEADRVGPRSDVFSLGAVLYLALTGEPPFAATSTIGCIRRLLTEELVPPAKKVPSVPRALDAICRKALAGEPEGRYANGEEMADDLKGYLFGRTLSVVPPPVPKVAAAPPRPTPRTGPAPLVEAAFGGMLFGQIALRLGLATRAQVEEALSRQERYRRLRVQKPIGAVLAEKGVLDEAAILRILRAQAARTEGAGAALAARVAVENGLATQAQVDECLALAQRLGSDGKGARSLPDLLAERKHIDAVRRRALLRALRRIEQGHTLGTTTVAWGVVECPSCYETVSRKAARCTHCGETLGQGEVTLSPVACPRCGGEHAAEGEFCMRCGTNLVTGELVAGAAARPCPACGTILSSLQQVCFDCGAHLSAPLGVRLREWFGRVTGWRGEGR